MEFVDIDSRSELPAIKEGHRYLDFLGGTKELRCFVIPYDMPRSHFVEKYAHLLDECLVPIYQNNGITVRQDASYPLPGFYILSFSTHFTSFDLIDELTHLRSFLLIRHLRKGMREKLHIPYIHFHYEEKPAKSCNVHYWLMPVTDEGEGIKIIYDLDIRSYLEQFRFQNNRKKILENNQLMREYIESINLLQLDNDFFERNGEGK